MVMLLYVALPFMQDDDGTRSRATPRNAGLAIALRRAETMSRMR